MTRDQRYFDEVNEGDRLPALEKCPSLVDVVKWSGATWTFVPIFYDRDLARSQGLPDSVIPGPMKLAFLDLLLTRWAGPEGRIRALRAAYRRPDVPNQPVVCRGVVTRTAPEASGGLVELELWIEDSHGEHTVSGAATVELPARPPATD